MANGRARRFAFLSTCVSPWGGSEEMWFEAACALREQGHSVDVLKTLVDRDHPRVRRLRRLGCSVRDLCRAGPAVLWIFPNPVLFRRPRPNRRRIYRAVSMLLRGPISVYSQLVAGGILLSRRPHLAIVSQGRNFDGAYLARICDRLDIPYVLVSQKASETVWPDDPLRPYVGRVYERARRSVFVSEHNRRLTEQQLAGPIAGATVLHNPVLVSRGEPLPWPSADDGELRLACVARYYLPDKSQDLLLEVLALERWRDRPVHVSFYGEGINREGIEALARRLELESVSFHGYANSIEDVWRTHHALLLPSRSEGMSLALMEAMACGRMPIVTDVGGATEIVDDEVTGFVAAGPFMAAIDDALERAWLRRDEWQAMGALAARRIDEIVPPRQGSALADLLLDELGLGEAS